MPLGADADFEDAPSGELPASMRAKADGLRARPKSGTNVTIFAPTREYIFIISMPLSREWRNISELFEMDKFRRGRLTGESIIKRKIAALAGRLD